MFYQAFRKAPFMRVLIPLSAGIMFNRYGPAPGMIIWLSATLLTILLLLMMTLSGRARPRMTILSGPRNSWMAAMFQAWFLCSGWLMGREKEPGPLPEVLFHARVCEEILEGEGSFKTTLDRVCFLSGEKWIRLDGRVQAYFQKQERCRDLMPGDGISGMGRLEPYRDPYNPFEFNYGAYQRGKGIGYHTFVDSTSWIQSPVSSEMGLKIRSKRLRLALMDHIDRNIRGQDEKAILYSLLLGYREELDPGTKQQFMRSGSMHILAVSGLHVGILYLLPALLIRKIRGGVALRAGVTLAVLAGLWGYAMLTGFSPSVVRAVTMCSIHRMALLAGRKAGLLHVLSLTALIMVLARPGILFEAGFQLSFSAVAGISAFQHPLSKLVKARGWLPRYAWQLVTISLAAQLATAPLSMFYFHQFSYVFILSNLIVIPLATAILYVGLAFFLFSLPGLYPLSRILEWLAFGLKGTTAILGGMPGAYSQHISLLPVQVWGLYGILLSVGFFCCTRRAGYLQAMLAALIFFLVVSCFREFRVRLHESFYVFSLPRESAISFVRGKNHTLVRAGRIRGDTLQMPYALRNFALHYKLGAPVPACGKDGAPWCLDRDGMQFLYTQFKSRRILIIKQLDKYKMPSSAPLKTDILVLLENAACNPDSVINVFNPGLVIVDGSSQHWYHMKMERAFRQHRIPFHSTEKDGFYAY